MMTADTQSLTSSTTDLSIAIVSYNTKEMLLDCIRSIQAYTTTIAYEVIVVDNDSRDGTVAALKDAYPGMRIVANSENRGFAKAVNQALGVSRGRHVLLLNSDTIVRDQALATMVAYLDDHPDVGAVSCKQWTGDGKTGAGNNYGEYSNKEYDDLLAAAAIESDPAKRMKEMSDAEAILMRDAPVMPLFYYSNHNLVSSHLKGFEDNVMDSHPSRFISKE